jgi:rhodanese-related sulfurtransferase
MADAKVENWTAEQVQEAFDRNEIVLIDVRTPQEYLLEHIEGVMLVPMAEFVASSMPTQTDKRIVLHCGSGIRSARVAEMCLSAGMDRIAHMEGGFAAWKAKKLPYIGLDFSTGAPKRMT